MLTKAQLQFINRQCVKGGFLPPYNEPHWKDNSLRNAEHSPVFCLEGYHLFHRCGIPRILSLDVNAFLTQLVYH